MAKRSARPIGSVRRTAAAVPPAQARVGRPFPVEPVRTLDAMHLASAELLGEPPQLVTMVTKDSRVRDNAKALRYSVE